MEAIKDICAVCNVDFGVKRWSSILAAAADVAAAMRKEYPEYLSQHGNWGLIQLHCKHK